MKRTYCGHEEEYKKMRKKGIKSWNLRNGDHEITPDVSCFLTDAQNQSWFPQNGNVFEIGCGTAPILNKFKESGYKCTGIDISETAVEMANEAYGGESIQYYCDDICDLSNMEHGKYDIVIDGHCLHCITNKQDRRKLFQNVKAIMNEGGIFIILSMCSPYNEEGIKNILKRGIMHENIMLFPTANNLKPYSDIVNYKGTNYMPTRYIGDWHSILHEVEENGLEVELHRYCKFNSQDIFGDIFIVARNSDKN